MRLDVLAVIRSLQRYARRDYGGTDGGTQRNRGTVEAMHAALIKPLDINYGSASRVLGSHWNTFALLLAASWDTGCEFRCGLKCYISSCLALCVLSITLSLSPSPCSLLLPLAASPYLIPPPCVFTAAGRCGGGSRSPGLHPSMGILNKHMLC